MAKKKNAKKSITKRVNRRKKIGAISADSKTLLMTTLGGVLGTVVGNYAGKMVANVVEKNFDSLADYSAYINGAVQIAVSTLVLPKVVKQKSPLFNGFQLGMSINGGYTIIKATGALDALAGITDNLLPMVAGNTMTFNSVKPTPMVAGFRTKQMGIANHA